MKRTLMMGVAVLALSGGAAVAQVLPPSGPYVAADVGYSWSEGLEGTSNRNAADGQPYDWDFNAEDDINGFGRLGYRISPNWRVGTRWRSFWPSSLSRKSLFRSVTT